MNGGPGSFRSRAIRQDLIHLAASSSATLTAYFRATIPDVRVRARFRVMQDFPTAAYDGTRQYSASSITLWVALCGQSRQGKMLPVQNLVGTRAAPLAVPVDANLFGHAFTVESEGGDPSGNGAAEVRGKLVLVGNAGPAEQWTVEVCYQAMEPLTDAEWLNVYSKCALSTEVASG